MCIDHHAHRGEYICVGCVAILEYVNQLEKYTKPDLVEDHRRCDLCGAHHIDTQEKVAMLMESASYLRERSPDIPQSSFGKESGSWQSCYDNDKFTNNMFLKQLFSNTTQSVPEEALLDITHDSKTDQCSASRQPSTEPGLVVNLRNRIQSQVLSRSSQNSLGHVDRKANSDREKRYVCSVCYKVLKRRDALTRHMRIHTGEQRYTCTECGKAFSDKCNLVMHTRVHTGERPFSCTKCNRAFTQQGELVRHTRTHTGDRPYSCTKCKKMFTYRGYLVSHIRTHTADRPYKCDKCDKEFTQASNRARHIKRKHPEK